MKQPYMRGLRQMQLVLLCLLSLAAFSGRADQAFIQETSRKGFDDVLADLEFAITEQNFRIVGRNEIGRGIRERGTADFPHATVIQFCNLTLAKEALELDPGLIDYMPCRIAVYEDAGRVYVRSLLLPEEVSSPRLRAFSHEINALLRDMVRFAVE